MNNYFLYIHKNKVNGKVYVGITGQKDVSSRWRKDGSGYIGHYFYNAILKYGWDNFEHIVLYSNLTKEDAIRLEQETIGKFNSNNRKYGYNLTSGGEITTYNEEARRRIREKCLGRKASKETREILRRAHLGKKLSQDTINKILEARRGFKHTEESKAIMREKALGRVFTAEHLNNLSISHKGKKYSEQYKLNMRMNSPRSVRVYCVETNKLYYSYYHAAEEIFGNSKCSEPISKCVRGIKKDYKGYHFIKGDQINE